MSPSNRKKVGSLSPDFWVIINQPHFVSDQSPVFHCSSSKIRDSKLIRFCTIRTSEGICIIVSIILENISRRRYFQKKKWSKLTLENPSIISIAIFLGYFPRSAPIKCSGPPILTKVFVSGEYPASLLRVKCLDFKLTRTSTS